MAKDGSLNFDTKIDEKGFKKGLSSLDKLGKSSMKALTGIAKATGVAILGIATASAKVGMDFEAGMSQVKAISGATDAQMKDLTKTAKQLGATTSFSATEAAEGMQYLAMAGFETNDIMSAMPGILNAAAAGSVDLGTAADITSNILSGFNMEADQSGRIADVLTKTFTTSNTTMESLGETMKYVAPVANTLGFSFEEMAAATGVLGDNAISGGQAGTVLRASLLRLSGTSTTANKEMARLGITTKDASGEMLPFPDIIDNVAAATEGMTGAQKAAVYEQLVGQQAVAGFSALVTEGGEALRGYTTDLENAGGTAERVAKVQLENLKGKLTILKSGLEGIGISLYENMDTPLNAIADTVQGYVTSLGDIIGKNAEVKEDLKDMGVQAHDLGYSIEEIPSGMSAFVSEIGNIVADMLLKIAEAVPKMVTLAADLISAFLNSIIDNAASLGSAGNDILLAIIGGIVEIMPLLYQTGLQLLLDFAKGFTENIPQMLEMVVGGITELITILLEMLPQFMAVGRDFQINLVNGIMEQLPHLIETGMNIINTLIDIIIENIPLFLDMGVQILTTLIGGITEALPGLIESAVGILTTLTEKLIEMLPLLIGAAESIMKSLTDFIKDNLPMIMETAMTLIMELVAGLMDNIPMLIDAALSIMNSLVEFIMDNLPTLVAMAIDLIQTISETLMENIPILVAAAIEIMNGLITYILDNLPALIDMAIDLVITIVETLLNNIPMLVDAGIQLVFGLIDGLFNNLPALLTAAITLITRLIGAIIGLIPQIISTGLQIMGEFVVGILKILPRLPKIALQLVKTIIAGIRSGISGMVSIGFDVIKGFWNGISNAGDWLMGKIKGFMGSVTKGIKSFFGIGSPSKLFEDEVGHWLPAGISVGFEEGVPDLEKDMENELDGIARGMQTEVELQAVTTGQNLATVGANKDKNIVNAEPDDIYEEYMISGNNFYVRDESDIEKIARELLGLQRQKARGGR